MVNDHHRELLIHEIRKYNNKYNLPNHNYESLSLNKYTKMLNNTAIVKSPFGLGEICYRDFEILFSGCLMIKPDMKHIKYCRIFIYPWKLTYPVDGIFLI